MLLRALSQESRKAFSPKRRFQVRWISSAAPMTRKLISSGTAWERKYAYSRAVQVDNLVAIAGTTAVDERGKVVGRGSPKRQAKFIYEKIARALDAVTSTSVAAAPF